jgi:hypothetical protein
MLYGAGPRASLMVTSDRTLDQAGKVTEHCPGCPTALR